MWVIGDKNEISEDVFDFKISYLPFPQKSIRSELAKLFSISIYSKFNSLPNDKNFWLLQIEWICRRQNKCDSKPNICFGKGRKHCGKGENAGYQHFLLFPQCFQKTSYTESLKVGAV